MSVVGFAAPLRMLIARNPLSCIRSHLRPVTSSHAISLNRSMQDTLNDMALVS